MNGEKQSGRILDVSWYRYIRFVPAAVAVLLEKDFEMPLESFTRRVSAIPPGHLHEAKQIERLLRADRLFAGGEMRLLKLFVRHSDAFANGAERLFHSRDTGQRENDLQFVGELRSPRLVFNPQILVRHLSKVC